MPQILRYLSHPQVIQNPDVPIQQWSLSDKGRQRLEALNMSNVFPNTGKIVSSTETKAIESADIVATSLAIDYEVKTNMYENDRSATGYLRPDIFEATADEFFAKPTESTKGWERAIDAQARIVEQTEAVLSENPTGDILLVGHGAVGTLLFCHYAGHAISRVYDQPAGGGNVFAINLDSGDVVYPWLAVETLDG